MSAAFDINLNSFDIIKEFETVITNMKGKFELCVGHYIVDAKSVLGILSLDLTRPIQLKIADTSEKNIETLKRYCAGGM